MRHVTARGRRLAVAAVILAVGPLASTRAASAGALSTLHVEQPAVAAGAIVSLEGRNYSASATSADIEVRLDGRDGPVIATISRRSSLVDVPVTIPLGTAPGAHLLVTTQTVAGGRPLSGSPGRASIIVAAPRSASGAAAGIVPAAGRVRPPGAAPGGSWTRSTPAGLLIGGLVPVISGVALASLAVRRRRAGKQLLPALPGGATHEGMSRKIRSPLPLEVAT